MDWSLVIFIIVVVIFAYRGYRKGLLRSLSRVLSLVAGYIAAILYSQPGAAIVESQLQLDGIVAYIVASLILFFGAGLVVSALFWLIAKLISAPETPSTASSCGGAALGMVFGIIVAVIVVWVFAFLRDMRPADDLATVADPKVSSAAVANPKVSSIENLTSRAASKAVHTAMSFSSANPEVIRLSTAMVEAPADITQHARQLASSDDLRALLNAPDNQAVLNSGDVNAVTQLPAFQQLAKNPDMLALAKSAGMLDESGENTQAVEAALASNITDIWGRMQRVQDNQRVQEILADPEFQQKINSGNPLDLLTNAKLMELADIIFSDDTLPNDADRMPTEDGKQNTPKKGTAVYSWTDKNGRVHYGDVEAKP